MFKLKFHPTQPLADNRATAEQKNSWFHPERNLDPAQKNNIHGPTASLMTAQSQAMGESEVTHECPAFAANAGGVDPLGAQGLR
jgi:hypothetical protein